MAVTAIVGTLYKRSKIETNYRSEVAEYEPSGVVAALSAAKDLYRRITNLKLASSPNIDIKRGDI